VNATCAILIRALLIFIIGRLILQQKCFGQERQSIRQLSDSNFKRSLPLFSSISKDSTIPDIDSILLSIRQQPSAVISGSENKFKRRMTGMDTLAKLRKTPVAGLALSRKPLVIKNGFISYNYSYRSGMDTPYVASDIQQHLINASAEVTIEEKLPLRIYFAERRSNLPYIRNYTDLRIDFDSREFRRIQNASLQNYFNKAIDQIRDSSLPANIDYNKLRFGALSNWLHSGLVIKKLLRCKENLIYSDELKGDSARRDTVLKSSKEFIQFYEGKQKQAAQVGKKVDSLEHQYWILNKRIQQLRNMFSQSSNSAEGIRQIKDSLQSLGVREENPGKFNSALLGIRSLSIGRTTPALSNLTVNQVNVRGLNVDYEQRNVIAGMTAGLVDYNNRDFFQSNQSSKQYVVAGKLGYGKMSGNHLMIIGYTGQKQIFISQFPSNTSPVSGLSLVGQWVFGRNHRLIAEMAQSAVASGAAIAADSGKKHLFWQDNSARAWSLQWHSYIPETKTTLEGMYQHTGINFQSFTAYKVNASVDAWNLRADQYLWKGLLHVTAAVRKNDYNNPLVLQNYNSNTIFTTLTATLHKRFWPTLSVGYIPSSQFSVINGLTYESRYQSFNVTANHFYKIGTANANTTIMYNRFFNDSRDSGFVYYNARNLYWYQTIQFTAFTANLSFSHTQNSQYLLDIMEAGLDRSFKRMGNIGFGIKLNHLNTEENKIGYYINGRINVPNLGTLNIWGEKSFLPGAANTLLKNEFVNVGFSRYFN
jgi:hypothetical protein